MYPTQAFLFFLLNSNFGLLYQIFGHWCHIIVLNVHAPTEDKTDDVKGSFYEELERVFDKFPKYHTKILLDFNAKVGREGIFKLTIGNESLHDISNDNGVGLVNFATSKNHRVKSTMFPHRNIHKYTWTSPDGKTHNQIDHILLNRRRLFTLEEMGDRKPSQFLKHLRSLAPDIPDNYLRILWTSRLPTNIRTILAGMPEVELDAVALCPDRIMETVSP
jgi:hypothetical protein